MIDSINIKEKFNRINEYWTPKIIGELNGQYIKLAKLKGDFIWHNHQEEDELFMLIKGKLLIDFRDKTSIINEGEIIVVPKGVDHKPRTEQGEEAWVMLFEPIATKHTGDIDHEKTVHRLDWL